MLDEELSDPAESMSSKVSADGESSVFSNVMVCYCPKQDTHFASEVSAHDLVGCCLCEAESPHPLRLSTQELEVGHKLNLGSGVSGSVAGKLQN